MSFWWGAKIVNTKMFTHSLLATILTNDKHLSKHNQSMWSFIQVVALSGVGSPKFWGGGKYFDFKRGTVFFGNCLSKHKAKKIIESSGDQWHPWPPWLRLWLTSSAKPEIISIRAQKFPYQWRMGVLKTIWYVRHSHLDWRRKAVPRGE